MNLIISKVVVILLAIVVVIPNIAYARRVQYVYANGAFEIFILSGYDVCEHIRRNFALCTYIKYVEEEDRHYVSTVAAESQQDRLIVKDLSGEIIDDYLIPAGSNHRESVAERQGVSLYEVQWNSGEETINEDYQYQANISLVERGNDRIIVKNMDGDILADYIVPVGTISQRYVAEQLGLDRNQVRWTSGREVSNKEYQYEGILTIWEDAPLILPPDGISVRNENEEIIVEFLVDSGTDHINAVAEKMNVSRDQVVWLFGRHRYNDEVGYQSHLLVRQ